MYICDVGADDDDDDDDVANAGYSSSLHLVDQHLTTAYPDTDCNYPLPMDTAVTAAVAGNTNDGEPAQLQQLMSQYGIGMYILHLLEK